MTSSGAGRIRFWSVRVEPEKERNEKYLEAVCGFKRIERIIHENELDAQNRSLRGGRCFWKQVWQ